MKILNSLAIVSLLFISTHTNAGFFDEVNKALGTVNQVLGTPSSSSVDSITMANISTAQVNKIDNALQVRSNNSALNQAVMEAKDNIKTILTVGGCQTNVAEPLAIGSIISPSAYIGNSSFDPAMHYTRYHPSNQCMTVENIGEWNMPALNAIEFVVVYVSEVSGEAEKRKVEFVKENGKWLATQHYQIF